jgi:uncharacterized metal-binding protein/predicted Fe-Mo cluster-binding NifX family protein
MRYGIPILADRIAPRCTFAEAVLVVQVSRRRITDRSVVPLEGNTWADLARLLTDHQVETLVCGGISLTTRESLQVRDIAVIDNVTGTVDRVVEALRREIIRPGFGFTVEEDEEEIVEEVFEQDEAECPINCLECEDRRCLRGETCSLADLIEDRITTSETRDVLEAAMDVASERERTLCRLAELVYFCLDMGYRRLGVAYCIDLAEPAAILTGVLQRFFETIPVCCKVGGNPLEYSHEHTACNPAGQAAVLNAKETDINIIVGLCVGADCIFTRESRAPVTTIFVKDRSLANNPIGAVYSHYYLEDI